MGNRYKAKALSRKDICRLAKTLRELLGMQEALYVDVVRLIELVLPKIDPEFEVEILENSAMDDMAVTFPEKHKMYIREDTYQGAIKGNGRDRFTIAHEIGHYILHDVNSISFARGSEEIKSFESPEWQANAFAAEFLMPRALLSGMSQQRVSTECGVSAQAAKYQVNAMKKDRIKSHL